MWIQSWELRNQLAVTVKARSEVQSSVQNKHRLSQMNGLSADLYNDFAGLHISRWLTRSLICRSSWSCMPLPLSTRLTVKLLMRCRAS